MTIQQLKDRLHGANVPLLTPFKADFSLDEEGFQRNLRFLIHAGIRGDEGFYIAGGSVGQGFALTMEERKRVFELAVEAAAGQAIIFCGCSHSGTELVIELARYAQKAGADGIMIAPPYYYRPSDKAILRHYLAVANAVDMPIMVYNTMWTAHVDMTPELIIELAKIPNAVALKECTPRFAQLRHVVGLVGDRMAIIEGNFAYYQPFGVAAGAVSSIDSVGNFDPWRALRLWRAEAAGDLKQGMAVVAECAPLLAALGEAARTGGVAQPVSAMKTCMELTGHAAGPSRLPLYQVSPEIRERLRVALVQMGLLN